MDDRKWMTIINDMEKRGNEVEEEMRVERIRET
jgi:flagellar biosynthesis regulator FlaF